MNPTDRSSVSTLHPLRILVSLLALAFAAGMGAPDGQAVENEDVFTALGIVVGLPLWEFGLSEDERAIVQRGMVDALDGKAEQPTEAILIRLGKIRDERVAKLSAEFLGRVKKEPGAKAQSSGLVYFEIEEGSGPQPAPSDTVKVHYHGTLANGIVFDSSVQRGQPAEFPLNRVIACWTEGVGMMKVGGKAKLVCPPSTAYGDRGAPPKIPGGAALTFEVELLEIQAAAEPPASE